MMDAQHMHKAREREKRHISAVDYQVTTTWTIMKITTIEENHRPVMRLEIHHPILTTLIHCMQAGHTTCNYT